ncbi:dihydrodipicolinate synthase family protein [Olivibacter sp. SDN3]|uniref:dihydrodipicolinate synthase family protein n=1 Tax=Olivibacter sp. SDN3 TaxID=2764720 RepID=UPI0016514573|nr:dihydrodipicolinate synthase family protein [Olivibacter sp. SDN3]QNL49287.1 dihydrodipicolinate synthase family protein [Olivibacter sp. SDN3]
MNKQELAPDKKKKLLEGTVIPAHPLALDADRKLDEKRQRQLTAYYLATGAGGIAIGVHSTQFAIRDPKINLYERVLELAADEIGLKVVDALFLKVAGICGTTTQALKEAAIARKYGYDLGLVSLAGLNSLSEQELIEHIKRIAEVIPIFGFYLQPSVGGRILSYDFWLKFAEIRNVHAIKVASFNRYQTLDVVRAVCHSSRPQDIALYTGNDDNIVADLLTSYTFPIMGKNITKQFVGGLLGHWAVWTQKAVELLQEVKQCKTNGYQNVAQLLTKGTQITDMNAAIFDPAHDFHGCIPGIHEVLRKQGLLKGRWCLDVSENLSEGQLAEIDRVCKAYPQLTDDAFVEKFLSTNPTDYDE